MKTENKTAKKISINVSFPTVRNQSCSILQTKRSVLFQVVIATIFFLLNQQSEY
jgi:hypothetical protein